MADVSPFKLKESDIEFGEEIQILEPVDADTLLEYVREQYNLTGEVPDLGNQFPMPSNVEKWYKGTIKGQKGYLSKSGNELYAVYYTTDCEQGFHHWTWNSTTQEYRASPRLAHRRLFTKEKDIMANIPNPFNRQQGAAAVMGAINANPINFNNVNQGNAPFVPQDSQPFVPQPNQPVNAPAVPQPAERGGVAGGSPEFIHALFRQNGYLVGYIARNGPQTTIAATTSTNKNSSTRTKSLTVKQTKPSAPEAILFGIPKGCILRDNGQPARPNEINNGEVATNLYENNDLIHFAIPRDTACRYLSALGSEATEYQPTHTGNEHISENSEKYYKTYISAINKPSASSKKSSTSFTLRTEDPARRSFYTPMNVFFLRVAAHRKFNGIKSVEDEYMWNTHIFSHFGNARAGRNSTGSTLNQLYQDAQSQIFRKSYTINGEVKDNAIGSAFFMQGDSMTIGEGNNKREIVKQALNVVPWHAARKDSTTKPVDSLVWRVEVWNKDGTVSSYRPKQLTYSDYQDGFATVNAEIKNKEDKIDVAANRALFASNDAFVDKVTKLGFDLDADILRFANRKAAKASKRVSQEEVTRELNSSNSRDAVSADYQALMARSIQLTSHR